MSSYRDSGIIKPSSYKEEFPALPSSPTKPIAIPMSPRKVEALKQPLIFKTFESDEEVPNAKASIKIETHTAFITFSDASLALKFEGALLQINRDLNGVIRVSGDQLEFPYNGNIQLGTHVAAKEFCSMLGLSPEKARGANVKIGAIKEVTLSDKFMGVSRRVSEEEGSTGSSPEASGAHEDSASTAAVSKPIEIPQPHKARAKHFPPKHSPSKHAKHHDTFWSGDSWDEDDITPSSPTKNSVPTTPRSPSKNIFDVLSVDPIGETYYHADGSTSWVNGDS